jgi:O-antigen/teichoic acid export membrane protein
MAAAVIGYLFNPFWAAPRLGPEGIAVLGTFLYLNFVFAFPQRPVDTGLVRTVAHHTATGQGGQLAALLNDAFKRLWRYGLAAGAALAVVSPVLTRFLKLDSPGPVLAAIALGLAGLVLTGFRAPILARLRVGQYSSVLLADVLTRLALGVALLAAGFHVWGAMLAYLGGTLAAVVLSFLFVRPLLAGPTERPTEDVARILVSVRPVFVYSFFVAVALGLDGIMAKHYFDEFNAGIYMAASTLAKMMFIVVSPIASVSFSGFCNAAARGQPITPLFLRSLMLTLAACVAAIIVSGFFSSVIVRLTYGTAFADAAALLPYTCLAFVPLAFLLIIANYYFTFERSAFLWGLAVGAVLQIALMGWHHGTAYALVASYGGGVALQCALAVIFGMRKK